MDISWDDAQTFLAVAEAGSISGGAKRLGLGQPTVSRRIALLEARLGVALFQRAQQGATVTEAGARLRPAAEQMARWAGEFGRIARGVESAPDGLVRIASPPALAVDFIAPLAAALQVDHPSLRVEILASVAHVDLVRGDADLAIRTRRATEPELMTLAAGSIRAGVFASPEYVRALTARRHDAGRSGPVELAEIDWITWARPFEHVPPRPMLARAIPDLVPAFTSDDYLVQRAAAVAGLGAMILDERGAELAGLAPIDVGFDPPATAFGLVCAKSAQHVPRIRLVADWIARQMAALGVVAED
ncbi:MAG: LysR family transcriptional regulator [Myxococcota bacterium]